MFAAILHRLLRRAIRWGRLTVTYPDGSLHHYDAGTGPAVAVQITDSGMLRHLMINPQMALGEGYMDGSLVFEDPQSVRDFLQIVVTAAEAGRLPWPMRMANRLRIVTRALRQRNGLAASRRLVKHHYDIPDEFYRLFLDQAMQYTCAYFRDPSATLEQAQVAKMDHIAAKLCLHPGNRVLDIGSGWGGLALHLARQHGADVTGITLSQVQLDAANRLASDQGMAHQARFRLQDYRNVPDRFDRIVSVGMLEHVGAPHYGAYFRKIAETLAEDGVALIQFIGRATPPRELSPWFQRYIFPGGHAPALSEILPHIENAGLVMTDAEVWRGHYERTLRHWQNRFLAHQGQVRAMFDDRFIRMWWWYLVAAEVSFTHMGMELFQVQLARRPDAVPMTRDYLYSAKELYGAKDRHDQ